MPYCAYNKHVSFRPKTGFEVGHAITVDIATDLEWPKPYCTWRRIHFSNIWPCFLLSM